ncbi:hypothetical protein B0H17DRAFT_1132621 [Mycena rosella]|uniref:Secreted protein n=1 Tax=Mycena rosella TaxID=1033263 RepID=A0AAD7DJI6_MYCRO|nr:hypothetical protein B0H17DRAFT_1132621 [Mycena rosella]
MAITLLLLCSYVTHVKTSSWEDVANHISPSTHSVSIGCRMETGCLEYQPYARYPEHASYPNQYAEANFLLVTLNARDCILWTSKSEAMEMQSGVRFHSGGDTRAGGPTSFLVTQVDLDERNDYSRENCDSKPNI